MRAGLRFIRLSTVEEGGGNGAKKCKGFDRLVCFASFHLWRGIDVRVHSNHLYAKQDRVRERKRDQKRVMNGEGRGGISEGGDS